MKKKILTLLAAALTTIMCVLGIAGCAPNNTVETTYNDAAAVTATAAAEGEEARSMPTYYEEDDSKHSKSKNDTYNDTYIDENGEYTSKDDVALYIHTYGHLPSNFITKKEAKRLGWQGGKLEPYAPGKSIGGDHFGNYEGQLPEKKGRSYTECDIDTKGKKRGSKRIIFSNDGLIYYTGDHYETFTLLYGEE